MTFEKLSWLAIAAVALIALSAPALAVDQALIETARSAL